MTKRGLLNRQSAYILAMRARFSARRGKWSRAAEFYARASLLTPDKSTYSNGLAKAVLKAGKSDKAEAALMRALSRNPAQPAALLAMAKIEAKKGDQNRSLAFHRIHMALDPWAQDAEVSLVQANLGGDVDFFRRGPSAFMADHSAAISEAIRSGQESLQPLREAVAGKLAEMDAASRRIDDAALERAGQEQSERHALKRTITQLVVDISQLQSQMAGVRDLGGYLESERIARANLDQALQTANQEIASLMADTATLRHAFIGLERNLAESFSSMRVNTEALLGQVLVGENQVEAPLVVQALDKLAGRIEFVRRELMYEFHHGARRDGLDDTSLRTVGEILNPEKIAAQKGNLHINLGCGHVALDDYVNVDRRALPGVDIVSEIDDLPLEAASVAKLHSAHLLEHFPEEELTRRILPYWRSLIAPGGVFSAVVPDGKAMMKQWTAGTYPFHLMREVMYGSQDYMGDYHYNLFTPESLTNILEDQGFRDIEIVAEGRLNGNCYEFEIKGRLEGKAALA